MSKRWFEYPPFAQNAYQTAYLGPGTDTPHYAYDLQTPFHTPITAPLAGTVKEESYQDWGGEIFIQPDNPAYPEYYFYHPDEIEVKTGQHVNVGQEIALSGGENPGYPGAEHPAQKEWSSGPHTHVGWFTGWKDTAGGRKPFGPDTASLIAIAESGAGGTAVTSSVPSSVYTAVEPYAQQYGVPDPIWETIAQVESGFNPSALGDNGTSFGLFQLHIGGQFPSAYASNPTALNDPALNAKYAMPAIGKAWQALSATFDASSPAWWEQFAAQSGHPGGSPGETVTDNEANSLEANFAHFAAAPSGPPLGDVIAGNPFSSVSTGNPVSDALSGVTTWIQSTIGGFAMRIGVGLAGIALIWIGAQTFVQPLREGQNEPEASNTSPDESAASTASEQADKEEKLAQRALKKAKKTKKAAVTA